MSATQAGKTPISLLQELCTKRGITPQYDLINIEGPVHEPTFVYRVTVGELCANGQGSSKKKAKHAAAQNALDKISGMPESCPVGAITNPSVTNGVESVTAKSPVGTSGSSDGDSGLCQEGGAAGNPIGSLQELTMANHWPPPIYELVNERGQPHEREFIIAVKVHKFSEEGVGRSKKVAKRAAALKMMKMLQGLPIDHGKAKDEGVDEGMGALSLRDKPGGGTGWYYPAPGGPEIPATAKLATQFAANIQKAPSSLLTKLIQMSLAECLSTVAECHGDPRVLLQKISQEQHMDTQYVEVQETTVRGHRQCLVQLGMQPVAVVGGTGQTIEESQTEAAANALHYLRIIVRCAAMSQVVQSQDQQLAEGLQPLIAN